MAAWSALGALIHPSLTAIYLIIIQFGLTSKDNHIPRKRPPSTARLTPRIPPDAGRVRKVIADAVSRGSINRSIGTWLIQPLWTSSTVFPVRWLMDDANEPKRSVLVNPGSTLLMVMQGGNSLDKLLAHEAIAPRRVLERPIFGIGSFTEVEIIWTIRP